MVPLVYPPQVSSVSEPMDPIMAKVGQDEIKDDSHSKRQMSLARGSRVIAG